MLVGVYGYNAPPQSTCKQQFRKFKIHDFSVKDKEREGASKRFKYNDLEVILDETEKNGQYN